MPREPRPRPPSPPPLLPEGAWARPKSDTVPPTPNDDDDAVDADAAAMVKGATGDVTPDDAADPPNNEAPPPIPRARPGPPCPSPSPSPCPPIGVSEEGDWCPLGDPPPSKPGMRNE